MDISLQCLMYFWLAHLVGLVSSGFACELQLQTGQRDSPALPGSLQKQTGKSNSVREQGAHSSQCAGLGTLGCGVITDLLANDQHLPDWAALVSQLPGCCFQHTLLQIWHHNLLTTSMVFTISQRSQKKKLSQCWSDNTRPTQKLQMIHFPKTKMGLIYETELGDVLSFLLCFYFSCSTLQ